MVISTLLTLLASTFTPAVLVTVAEASEIFLAIAVQAFAMSDMPSPASLIGSGIIVFCITMLVLETAISSFFSSGEGKEEEIKLLKWLWFFLPNYWLLCYHSLLKERRAVIRTSCWIMSCVGEHITNVLAAFNFFYKNVVFSGNYILLINERGKVQYIQTVIEATQSYLAPHFRVQPDYRFVLFGNPNRSHLPKVSHLWTFRNRAKCQMTNQEIRAGLIDQVLVSKRPAHAKVPERAKNSDRKLHHFLRDMCSLLTWIVFTLFHLGSISSHGKWKDQNSVCENLQHGLDFKNNIQNIYVCFISKGIDPFTRRRFYP